MIPIDPVTMPLGGDVSVMKTSKSGAMDTNANSGGQLVSIMDWKQWIYSKSWNHMLRIVVHCCYMEMRKEF